MNLLTLKQTELQSLLLAKMGRYKKVILWHLRLNKEKSVIY